MDARWQQTRPPAVECTWHGVQEFDAEAGVVLCKEAKVGRLHWVEKARHALLLLRLQRPYFLYCLVCAMLSTAAFLSTMLDLIGERKLGRRWIDILEGGTWQSACWTAVALALCAEVLSSAIVSRGSLRCLLRDWWSAFDGAVVFLTVLAWAIMRLRSASIMREEAEEADLWLLTIRFALQPCRVFAAAKMAHKVQLMQQSHMDIDFDALAGPAQGQDQVSTMLDGFQNRTPSSSTFGEATTPMPSIFDEER